jgi:hypothetical protein
MNERVKGLIVVIGIFLPLAWLAEDLLRCGMVTLVPCWGLKEM